MNIEWEDPPPDGRTSVNPQRRRSIRREEVEFIQELQRHPGKWAVFRRQGRANDGTYLKEAAALLNVPIEAVNRNTSGRTAPRCDVYARAIEQ